MNLSRNQQTSIILFIVGIVLTLVNMPVLGGICVIFGLITILD